MSENMWMFNHPLSLSLSKSTASDFIKYAFIFMLSIGNLA